MQRFCKSTKEQAKFSVLSSHVVFWAVLKTQATRRQLSDSIDHLAMLRSTVCKLSMLLFSAVILCGSMRLIFNYLMCTKTLRKSTNIWHLIVVFGIATVQFRANMCCLKTWRRCVVDSIWRIVLHIIGFNIWGNDGWTRDVDTCGFACQYSDHSTRFRWCAVVLKIQLPIVGKHEEI